MASAQAELERLIAPAVAALGYELLGMEYLTRGRSALLRLYIDSEAGINLDDCERVSHQVSGLLEVEDPIRGHYNLEVSSPGLDRPLFKSDHYARFVGKPVRIKLRTPRDGRRKFSGAIERVSDETVVIHDTETDCDVELPLAEVEKANLIPEI